MNAYSNEKNIVTYKAEKASKDSFKTSKKSGF